MERESQGISVVWCLPSLSPFLSAAFLPFLAPSCIPSLLMIWRHWSQNSFFLSDNFLKMWKTLQHIVLVPPLKNMEIESQRSEPAWSKQDQAKKRRMPAELYPPSLLALLPAGLVLSLWHTLHSWVGGIYLLVWAFHKKQKVCWDRRSYSCRIAELVNISIWTQEEPVTLFPVTHWP